MNTDQLWPRLITQLWCGLLCVAILPSQSQAKAQSSGAPRYNVEGTVRNSVTGEAIARALVTLHGDATETSLLTGADGRFRYPGVAEGDYSIAAQKPGFFPENDSADTGAGSLHITGETRNVLLKVVPEAVIWGRAEDAEHEGLSRAYVTVCTVAIRDGRRFVQSTASTHADDDGNFRIANLAAGDYVIGLATNFDAAPVTSHSTSEQDWGYAPMFYPGVEDIAAADRVHVVPGQHAEVRFAVRPIPVYHVRGRVTGSPYTQPPMVYFDRPEVPQLGMQFVAAPVTREFQARYIAAGNYVAHALLQRGGTEWIADQMLSVTSNIDNVELTLSEGVPIPVVVTAADAGSRRGYVGIELVPEHWWMRAAQTTASLNEESGAKLERVFPGRYTVRVRVAGVPQRVFSLRSGNVDLLHDMLTVAAQGNEPIRMSLLNDTGALRITLPSARREPFFVIAYPLSAPTQPPLKAQANAQTATAEITNIPPGDYNVAVFDDLEQVAYAEADVRQKYASQMTRITVPEHGLIAVEATLIRTKK